MLVYLDFQEKKKETRRWRFWFDPPLFHASQKELVRSLAVIPSSIKNFQKSYRSSVGPRDSNNTAAPETNSQLKAVAVEGDMILSPAQINKLLTGMSNL